MPRSTASYPAESTTAERDPYLYFFEHHHAVMLLVDPEAMVIEEANPAAAAFYGYSREELVGKPISALNTLSHEAIKERIEAARAKSQQPFLFQHRLASGNVRDVEVYSGPVVVGGRELLASIVHDVTARIENESWLRRQKEIFEKIFEHLPIMVTFFNEDGDFELVNRAWEETLGWTCEETRAHPDMLGACFPEAEKRAEVLAYMQAAESEWRTFATRTKDGALLDTSWANVRLSDGTSIGIGQDVTEQRRAEESLRESEAKFRRLVEQSLVGITVVQQHRITYANPRIADLLGYDPEEMAGLPAEAIAHPDDRPLVREQVRRRLVGEADEAFYTFRACQRDGRVLTLEAHGTVVMIGGKRAIISSVMDVTARREAEAELRLRGAALKAAANGIVITDRAGKIVWANPAFTRLTGYELADVMGQNPRMLQSGVQDERFYSELWTTINAGDTWHGEIVNRRKDGTLYHEEMTITPVKTDGETITHFVAVKQDVTLRKQHEAELVRAKERAEEMARLKDVFLSNMSHEIRTPLASIIGAADILEEDAEGETRELAGFVRRGGERLMETLNSVLDLAGLEAGKQKINLEPLRLASMVEETLALFEPRARAKGLDLCMDLDDVADVRVLADRAVLGRVISNLVSNAIKFTDEGSITIRAREEAGEIAIGVIDTGIGISPEFLPHVFEEFRQESSGNTRRYEGNGLGLTITRRLVELMGGSISIQSEQGAGSTFTVRLPAAATGSARLQREAERRAEAADEYSVLLVDDDPNVRWLVPRMLRDEARVDVVAAPGEALRRAEAHAYDAVLLDINLRDKIDGVRVLQALRELEHYASTPVIALTAYGLPGDRDHYLEQGFDAYVSKPCTKADLAEALTHQLTTRRAAA